jgi:hypothetical protein
VFTLLGKSAAPFFPFSRFFASRLFDWDLSDIEPVERAGNRHGNNMLYVGMHGRFLVIDIE